MPPQACDQDLANQYQLTKEPMKCGQVQQNLIGPKIGQIGLRHMSQIRQEPEQQPIVAQTTLSGRPTIDPR